MPSPISAKEVLGIAGSTEFHAPILPQRGTRWARLRFDRVPGVDLRDHFRGGLIGGAIGDAERRRARETGKRWIGGIEQRRGGDTRPSGFRLGFFRGVMLPSCDG